MKKKFLILFLLTADRIIRKATNFFRNKDSEGKKIESQQKQKCGIKFFLVPVFEIQILAFG